MRPSKIQQISQQQLEVILAPHMRAGLVSTTYNHGTAAFEYRLPNSTILAVTVAEHHFCELKRVPMVNVLHGVV